MRILHRILEVLLRLRAALGEASGGTACADWSGESLGGRGEGGGVNIWWKDRGGVRSVGDGRNQLEEACTTVSNGVRAEGVRTNLADGEGVDVKGEASRLKTILRAGARHAERTGEIRVIT